MKFLTSQLTYLLSQRETRSNLRALLKYLSFLAGTVSVYAVLFRVLMLYEGQQHSWFTGFYWALTVMSTLGFGDITFHTDTGRAFSMLVLISGIVLLLIVLPFAFIRFFYAPWLEAQLRLRAPRKAPASLRDHVVICHYDAIARGLIRRLVDFEIPYRVIEEDLAQAAALHANGVHVLAGDLDAGTTYEAVRAAEARLVLANLDDAHNTNITLTLRESAPDVPVIALAEDDDSVDVLELSGATHVFPLKRRLGEQLASRVDVGTAHTHTLGHFRDLLIAEFPIHNTGLAGRTIRETRLRELTGLNVVATWERGKLRFATPETLLSDYSVPVVVGTENQLSDLDAMFAIYEPNENPVIVIGGGKVGREVARSLRRRQISVHMIERDRTLEPSLRDLVDHVFIGDAANLDVMMTAGLEKAPSVVISGNDDATNIFLAIYCRRLNPDVRIVSRINAERNLEAIHRAGADAVLSYSTLAVQSVLSIVQGSDTVILGEGVDVFVEPVPPSLVGKTLVESGIGAHTGLNVIAVQSAEEVLANPAASTQLGSGSELVMLGTPEQHHVFRNRFA
jgi:Trk K+ transport system NAD-binding subunit